MQQWRNIVQDSITVHKKSQRTLQSSRVLDQTSFEQVSWITSPCVTKETQQRHLHPYRRRPNDFLPITDHRWHQSAPCGFTRLPHRHHCTCHHQFLQLFRLDFHILWAHCTILHSNTNHWTTTKIQDKNFPPIIDFGGHGLYEQLSLILVDNE